MPSRSACRDASGVGDGRGGRRVGCRGRPACRGAGRSSSGDRLDALRGGAAAGSPPMIVGIESHANAGCSRATSSGGSAAREQCPVDLVDEVRAQIPCHGLQPGDRVDRRPRLGGVPRVLQAEHGVLERELCAAAGAEVGVHALGVRLVVGAGDRCRAARTPARRSPRQSSVRMKASVATCDSPNSSATRPAVTWRRKSISQNRSCACTKPWAKNRSWSVSATSCGMPASSRYTVTVA